MKALRDMNTGEVAVLFSASEAKILSGFFDGHESERGKHHTRLIDKLSDTLEGATDCQDRPLSGSLVTAIFEGLRAVDALDR